MSFQTHYYPRAGVDLHSSWGGWDGGNLGCMGTVVVWDPQGPWEGRSVHLLVFPAELLCVMSAHSVHFVRIPVAGLRSRVLGNYREVEGW